MNHRVASAAAALVAACLVAAPSSAAFAQSQTADAAPPGAAAASAQTAAAASAPLVTYLKHTKPPFMIDTTIASAELGMIGAAVSWPASMDGEAAR